MDFTIDCLLRSCIFLLFLIGALSWDFPVIFLAIVSAVFGVYFCCTFLATRYIENTKSNFAPVDKYDCIVNLPEMLSVRGIKRKYRHITNIYSTEYESVSFYLYLTETGKNTESMYICGGKEKQNLVLSILSNKMKELGTNKIKLSLCFEGKRAGNVEVFRVHNYSQDERLLGINMPKRKINQTWRCEQCGYINSQNVSECKSCGRYRM